MTTTTPRKRAPGAGRPKLGTEKTVRITVTLPPAYIAYLHGVGAANMSEAVRKVIDRLAELETTEKHP